MSFKSYILPVLIFMFLLSVNCNAESSPVLKISFPEIQGFSKSGDPVRYKPDTLFEYIDGAAELYITYDFTELNLQVYNDKQGNTITAEIYDQQNVNNSFGIYSQERPYECEFLPIGTRANYMEGYLNFYQGRYYVKISGYNLGKNDKEYLTSAGKKISAVLDTESLPPKMLKVFPDEHKIKNREEYIARDFLGYSFFDKVFAAEYENAGTEYKLFIIEEPDRGSLEKSINEYKKRIGSTENILNGGSHELDDPYQGKLIITVSGKYIVGILNPDNAKIDPDVLNQVISRLK
jgi:hypothetical protein